MSERAGGWIKLHRDLARHRIWLKEPFTLGQAWVDLLMSANYHDSTVLRGIRIVPVKRGQVFTSLESLSHRWKRDRKTVRAWLLAFEADGMVDRATAYGADGGFTLITIRNFEQYQAREQDQLADGLDGATGGALDRGTAGQLARVLAGVLPTSKKSEEDQEEADARARESRSGSSNPWNGVQAGPVKLP